MKRFIPLLLLVSVSCLKTVAQNPGNKNRTVDTLGITKSYFDPSDTLVEQRLIELAMKSPTYSASSHQTAINELELRKAKNSWLNLLTISTNYNDQSFAKSSTTPVVYPKYYFGVTLPLGVIFSQGNSVKTAREAVALRKDQQEELARGIKADILSKYRQYKLYSYLIRIQSELINDVLAQAIQAEEDFKKGTIVVENYISTLKTKNDELAKSMTLKFQQDLVKLDIEKIIGVPLEQVIAEASGKK